MVVKTPMSGDIDFPIIIVLSKMQKVSVFYIKEAKN